MKNRTLATVGSFAAVVTLLVFSSVPASAQAIFTTTSTGTTVNANQFAAKEDVYLNGGPQNAGGGPGFAPGTYYFQVTDPSGATLLSSDSIFCRQVVVGSNGRINGVPGIADPNCTNTGGNFHLVGTFNTLNNSQGVQLFPFDNTPNAGGVYKVWLTAIGSYQPGSGSFGFGPSNIKTDNFKIGESTPCTENCGPPPQSTLSGVKYYDKARNGVLDVVDDGPVQGVTIHITSTGTPSFAPITTTTDAGGAFSAVVPLHAPFQVCEDKTLAPFTTGLWEQTGPLNGATAGLGNATAAAGCWNGIAEVDFGDLNFGNVAKITGTKYYDSNKDGVPNGVEPTIDGFKVLFCADANCVGTPVYTGVALTANGGTYSFYLPTATSSFQVCEVVPNVSNPANSFWSQTGPLFPASPIGNTGTGSAASTALKCWSGSGTVSGMYLTNICFTRPSGGFTLGFWSNKNGQALITPSDLAALVSLNLRNADGTNFDPASAAALKTWLLNGTATNMSYMLSVQMATTKLDTLHGLSASTLVDATAYGLGIVSIADLITAADALLAADGNAISGDPNRTIQEKYKNVFDAINNNLLNFVNGPGTCNVVYPLQ